MCVCPPVDIWGRLSYPRHCAVNFFLFVLEFCNFTQFRNIYFSCATFKFYPNRAKIAEMSGLQKLSKIPYTYGIMGRFVRGISTWNFAIEFVNFTFGMNIFCNCVTSKFYTDRRENANLAKILYAPCNEGQFVRGTLT